MRISIKTRWTGHIGWLSTALLILCVGFVLPAILAGCAGEPTATEEPGGGGSDEAPADATGYPEGSASAGFEMPEITVISAEDLRDTIESARGKVALVNFWATWCPPCVKEMPEFIEFYEEYPEDDVAFFSLTADHHTTIEDAVKPFVAQHELPFPVRVISAEPDDVAEAIGTTFTGALPVTLVYDQSGALHKAWYQEVELADLAEVIDPLIAS